MRSLAVCGLALAGAASIGGLLISSPGCNDSASSFCRGLCDCWQCSGSEYEECLDTVEDIAQSAARQGCPEAAEAFTQCAAEDVECMADRDAAEPTRCEGEQRALAECGVSVPTLGPLCERGSQRVGKCQGWKIDVGACAGPYPGRCVYACYASSSCSEVLSGSSQALVDCFERCAALASQPEPQPR
ncbi:MAG TPA: hypothetical protein VL242_02230 [Sorangium sp.]|uniref:hypothetical protein n=1 Tax=Sorangium sp. So ce1153 TaxID=3133333 RepID=UPI002C94F339|nr:hypothetical protein [Sorangium sp.]